VQELSSAVAFVIFCLFCIDQILAKLDSVTRSETFAILKKFLNVLDNSGQLAARLPQSIYQPCYKFVGRTDEPRG